MQFLKSFFQSTRNAWKSGYVGKASLLTSTFFLTVLIMAGNTPKDKGTQTIGQVKTEKKIEEVKPKEEKKVEEVEPKITDNLALTQKEIDIFNVDTAGFLVALSTSSKENSELIKRWELYGDVNMNVTAAMQQGCKDPESKYRPYTDQAQVNCTVAVKVADKYFSQL